MAGMTQNWQRNLISFSSPSRESTLKYSVQLTEGSCSYKDIHSSDKSKNSDNDKIMLVTVLTIAYESNIRIAMIIVRISMIKVLIIMIMTIIMLHP